MTEKEPSKKTFWAIWVFYLLIAFEIIYMISPFGIYYYSVYGRGLNFLNDHSSTAWLSSFFLPHIVKTSSLVLNTYKDVEGKELILNTVKRKPVVEVRIDLSQDTVIGIENPPANVRWGDIPTPLF
jgi:hypothetical protein